VNTGKTPLRTAIHEASHAVIARRLGLLVESVTLEPALATRGHRRWSPDRSRPADMRTRDFCEAAVCVLLAGSIGEAVLGGVESPDGLHAEDDCGNWGEPTQINDLLDIMFEMVADVSEERAAFLRWLQTRTRNMLLESSNSTAVRSVADRLLKEARLTAGDVDAECFNAR
jgi:hypothetical protein